MWKWDLKLQKFEMALVSADILELDPNWCSRRAYLGGIWDCSGPGVLGECLLRCLSRYAWSGAYCLPISLLTSRMFAETSTSASI